ncbi:MAG: vitamin K epoxide reductase family protein [Candidatus Niyogibacteria bacterium]|nr:vitamin K epoxide reductase family protein [Candidatus Niyogibacteria bacterium]
MIYRILAIILAFAGLGVMGYLTYLHYANAQSFCDFSEEVSCDVVTTSIYSEIFGIPVSLLGMGFFGTLLLLLFFYKKNDVFRLTFLLSVFMLVPSLYLTVIEATAIGSFCILCETSKAVMVLILIVSFFGMRTSGVAFHAREVMPIVIAGLLVIGITFFAQSGGGTKEDYTALFLCANENGVTYYKSVRCSSCRRQEKIFGPAYPVLNAIECHPEGEDPQPELCLEKDISKTPTFIREQNGEELKRAVGIRQIPAFAEFAGCPLNN